MKKPSRVLDITSGTLLRELPSTTDIFSNKRIEGWYFNPSNHTLYIRRSHSSKSHFEKLGVIIEKPREKVEDFYEKYIGNRIRGSLLDFIIRLLAKYFQISLTLAFLIVIIVPIITYLLIIVVRRLLD